VGWKRPHARSVRLNSSTIRQKRKDYIAVRASKTKIGDIDRTFRARIIRDDRGTRELECDGCDATVVRRSSNITGEHVFCGDDCQYEWLSEAFTGEGHPNWKGGSTPNYGPGWRRAKRRALERDGRECVLCGATAAEIGRNPDVHHIVPVRAFLETPVTTERDAHYPANLACLCPTCHRKTEFGGVGRARIRSAIP